MNLVDKVAHISGHVTVNKFDAEESFSDLLAQVDEFDTTELSISLEKSLGILEAETIELEDEGVMDAVIKVVEQLAKITTSFEEYHDEITSDRGLESLAMIHKCIEDIDYDDGR